MLVDERRERGRLGDGSRRLLRRALDVEDPEHPLRSDVRARELVHRLGRGAQRQHEEGRVAVEGDEVAGVDLPGQRETRPEPGDEDDEDPRDEDLRRVERGLGEGNAHACLAHLLRAVPVAGEERSFAADPAQHAQSRRGVRAERRQLPDLVALHGLPGLERLDHEAHQQHEDRHADQDDEAERDRRREQDDRDDEVGDDRAGEARGDVECAAGAHGVVGDRCDDLARRVLLLDRRARSARRDARRPAPCGTRPAASSRPRSDGASRPPRPGSLRARAGSGPTRPARGCRRRRSRSGSRGRSPPASAPARPSRPRRRRRLRAASRPGGAPPTAGSGPATGCPAVRGR